MIYLPTNLIELRNEVLMCYLVTKSLWNLDFKIIYLPPNLIELKDEVKI